MNFRIIPELRKYTCSFTFFPRLFLFGGWVAVSSIVSPILVYLDRFLISSFLSIEAVAYYSAPYEVITRFLIIPTSMTMTLYPAFSTFEGQKDKIRVGTLFTKSSKYILLLVGPIILITVLFANEIMQIWLSIDFAKKSTNVLQILALGVLFNSLAQIPFTFLQGIGRPDIPAKFHLLELPIYIGIACFLISRWGIAGAALSWSLRVLLDAFLLFLGAISIYKFSPFAFVKSNILFTSFTFLIFASIVCMFKLFCGIFPLLLQFLLVLMLLGLFFWFTWRNVLDDSERRAVFKILGFGKE